MSPTQINPQEFPDSPYAFELQRSRPDLRFESALEDEYSNAHLRRMRLRVRVWFTFVFAIRILFAFGQARHTGAFSPLSLIQIFVLLPCSAFLVWLCWGSHYERIYLRVTPLLLPVFYALIAVFAVHELAVTRFEQFTAFAVGLIGVYFFAGLKFREAVFTNITLLISFVAASLIIGLATITLLKSIAVLIVTSVLVSIVYRDVEKSARREYLEHVLIGQLLTRDSLSGLMNRRAFDLHLSQVWMHALRTRCAIAVCMIDVDHFKHYNDAFGHQAGDGALSRIAGLMQEFARGPLDLAARYGGEEFSVILCDVSVEQVEDLAERLRARIQAERIPQALIAGSSESELTVSVGAALIWPSADRTPQGAVQLADEALYEAKRAGRNRIVVKGVDDYRKLSTGHFQPLVLEA
jgi:diguanylate cyclase (GGDEF)-like protein